MPRDSRLDPQPGDRVRIEGIEFVITKRDPFDVQYAPTSDLTNTRWVMDTTWKRMCSRNKAEAMPQKSWIDPEEDEREAAEVSPLGGWIEGAGDR